MLPLPVPVIFFEFKSRSPPSCGVVSSTMLDSVPLPADDVIVRGGENLSPGEIEDVLLTHPSIADVAVVGIPDEQWGEGVAAALVAKDGFTIDQEEIKEFVKAELRSSRVPQLMVVWDELPYNETGKLLRRVVREELSK